jgi:hypothetical protein
MHFVGILLLDSFSLIAQAPRPEPRQTAARGARVCTGPYLTSRYQTRSRRPSRSQFATIYIYASLAQSEPVGLAKQLRDQLGGYADARQPVTLSC